MGTVTRFWKNVERTKDNQDQVVEVIAEPTSLDVLTDQVRRAYNVKVHCEAELARAQHHLERCQQSLVNRMVEVARENGIRDFKIREL